MGLRNGGAQDKEERGGGKILREETDAFFAMVKKQLIVLTRYPISFITSFAMVFIFMLLFIFAIAMFTPSHAEWENATVLSEEPFIAIQKGDTGYIAFEGNATDSAYVNAANSSFYPVNSSSSTVFSSYSNGTWTLEASFNHTESFNLTVFTGYRTYSWQINASDLPSGNVVTDGKIGLKHTDVGFAGIAFYGFIFFMFLQDIVWFIGYSLRDEQYQGTLESLYQTPANKFSNLVSRVFLNVVWTGLNVIVALLIVAYLFGALPAANVGFALFVLLLTLMQMFGMGFIFAAFTLRAKGSADFIMNFIAMVFTFTCAMFFPFSVLPKAMVDYISRWIPLSYSVDLFRSALLSYPSGFPELGSAAFELGITVIFAFLMPIIGYVLYWKIERSARMNGTLSEY